MKKSIAVVLGILTGAFVLTSPAYALRILVTAGDRVQEIDTYTSHILREYVDPQGEELASADRLPSGNLLIAKASKVFEIDMQGQIVWEKLSSTLGYQGVTIYDAQRLKNGNTLIAGSLHTTSSGQCNPMGGVLEVNRVGEVVWSYSACGPTGTFAFQEADRLSNGNTLISTAGYYYGRVLEVDQNSNLVWSYYPLSDEYKYYVDKVYDADRLPNGDTIISATANANGQTVRLVETVHPDGSAGESLWPMEVPEDADVTSFCYSYHVDRYLDSSGGRVFAINGCSSGSQIPWTQNFPDPPRDVDPLGPMNLKAVSGQNRILLAWDDYGVAIDYYQVERSETPGGPYTEIGGGTDSHFTDQNVTPGVTYYYVVHVMSGGLYSAPSNEASANLPKPGFKKP